MANTLSFYSLLDSDKLTESNFDSWYRKLKIVLEHEKILYILMDEAPEELVANAPRAMKDTYLKWLNDRMTMYYVMRTAINDELSCKFEDA